MKISAKKKHKGRRKGTPGGLGNAISDSGQGSFHCLLGNFHLSN